MRFEMRNLMAPLLLGPRATGEASLPVAEDVVRDFGRQPGIPEQVFPVFGQDWLPPGQAMADKAKDPKKAERCCRQWFTDSMLKRTGCTNMFSCGNHRGSCDGHGHITIWVCGNGCSNRLTCKMGDPVTLNPPFADCGNSLGKDPVDQPALARAAQIEMLNQMRAQLQEYLS